VAVFGLVLASGACAQPEGPESGSLDRATFVDAWVDLRTAALASPAREISPTERDRILAERGVTQEELLTFAEVHGSDVSYMKEIWDEVALRMRPEVPSPGDSIAGA